VFSEKNYIPYSGSINGEKPMETQNRQIKYLYTVNSDNTQTPLSMTHLKDKRKKLKLHHSLREISVGKVLPFMLLFFLISGLFITVFNPIAASNAVEDSWNTKAPLNVARYGMGVIEVNGKIYAIGGIAEGRHTNTNERYDPKTDKWVTLTPMPTSRAAIAVAAYQNKIYCIGGTGYDANTQGWVEVYDIATDSWDIKSYAPINTIGVTQAHTIDGKIFVTHRSTNKGNTIFDLYMYDPTTDSWTTKTGIQEKIMIISESFMMDNKMTVIGMFPDYTFAYKMLIPNSAGFW